MKIDDIKEKILFKIYNFAGYRARTQKEVVARLNKYLEYYKITDAEKAVLGDFIINKLTEEKFINDANYVKNITVSLQNSSNSRGKNYLKNYLLKKGVDSTEISTALNSLDDDNEIERATIWAQKKLKTLKSKNSMEAKKKLWQQLQYRGFSSDVIGRVIDNVLGVK